MRHLWSAVMLGALLVPVLASAQQQDSVVLRGLAGQGRALRAADLAGLPRREVRASFRGTESVWSGVSLHELVRQAGAPTGDSLRGPALASFVVVEARDGYRVVFALAELDPGFTERVILLADRKDGAPLPSRDGPWQVIVPGERRPSRWVRQVSTIRLQRAGP